MARHALLPDQPQERLRRRLLKNVLLENNSDNAFRKIKIALYFFHDLLFSLGKSIYLRTKSQLRVTVHSTERKKFFLGPTERVIT